MGEIAVPMFGYKNHIGINRTHGFIRSFTVTHAARHESKRRGHTKRADRVHAEWKDRAPSSGQ